jgi:peptidoglycan/LPS O-acetylase OafA/YrhL
VTGRTLGPRARRFGIALFFAAVGVNAALGVYAVLATDFGDAGGKALATSLCVTGAVVLALVCEPAWERRLLGPVPPAAAALGVVGFAVLVGGIWTERGSETWGRLTATTLTLAVAGAIASLLALARLARRHRWALAASLALVAVAATLVVGTLWLDDPPDGYVRALGAVLIVLAAFAVTVPVLHWVDRAELASTAARAAGAVAYCPYCGRPLRGADGAALACSRCGSSFSVQLREAVETSSPEPS